MRIVPPGLRVSLRREWPLGDVDGKQRIPNIWTSKPKHSPMCGNLAWVCGFFDRCCGNAQLCSTFLRRGHYHDREGKVVQVYRKKFCQLGELRAGAMLALLVVDVWPRAALVRLLLHARGSTRHAWGMTGFRHAMLSKDWWVALNMWFACAVACRMEIGPCTPTRKMAALRYVYTYMYMYKRVCIPIPEAMSIQLHFHLPWTLLFAVQGDTLHFLIICGLSLS